MNKLTEPTKRRWSKLCSSYKPHNHGGPARRFYATSRDVTDIRLRRSGGRNSTVRSMAEARSA